MDEKPRANPKELEAVLRSRVRQSRPNPLLITLVGLLLLAGPLALAVWWFWPQPEPPALFIVACDAAAPTDAEVTLHAVLRPRPEGEPDVRLSGWPVLFQEVQLGPARPQPPFSEEARRGDDGVAALTVPTPVGRAVVDYLARYAPDRRTQPAEDRGRVFVWPADTPLLLVDVEHALAQTDPARWQGANPRDIAPAGAAARALQELVTAKPETAVVYLACAVPRPEDYRKVRGWVQTIPLDGSPRLPDGPVLPRPSYAEGASEPKAVKSQAEALRERFRGDRAAVTADVELAGTLARAGYRTFLVGEHKNVPEGVTVVRQWPELPAALRK